MMANIIQNNEISPSSNVSEMKQKTISRHFEMILQNFHKKRQDWTRLNTAKFMVNIAFWMPIYILFGYLTITNSIEIIQNYQANPSYVNMTAIINQPTVLFPNYTTCVYLNVTAVFDAADATNRNGTNNSSCSDILTNFFSDYGEIIKGGNFNLTIWPNTTNGVVVRYLILMYELEAVKDPDEQQFDLQKFQQTNDDYWAAVRNVLVPKIAEYSISIDQLKATFDETFYGLGNYFNYGGDMGLNCIFEIASSALSNGCMPSNYISFIGEDSICFRILSSYINMGTTSQKNRKGISYQINIAGADIEGNNTVRWPFSLDYTGRSTPPPPPQTLSSSEQDVFFFPSSEWSWDIYFNITSLYISLPGVGKICSPDMTKEECEHQCRSNQIKDICGCAPITLSKIDPSITVANCTMDKYEKCSKYLANEDQNCIEKCVPHCAKWNYEFELITSNVPWDIPVHSVEIHLVISDYLIMTETYTWTFQLFVGALGGALGIWLGLDFGVLIEFLFNPIMMTIRKLLSNDGEVVEEAIVENDADQRNCLQKLIQASYEYGTSRPLIATWYFEKLFWTVIYTTGSVSTAVYCWDLIQQYESDLTQYNTAILFNKSIALPDTRLCLALTGGSIFYAKNAMEANKTMMLAMELENIFLNQSAKIGNREDLLDQRTHWPEPLLFVSYLYISILTQYELFGSEVSGIAYPYRFQITNGSIFDNYDSQSSAIVMDIENAFTNILIPKLFQWNVSVDELRQKVGQEIYKNFNVTITFYSSSISQRLGVLRSPRTELIVQTQICYTLPMNELLFTTDSDYFEISTKMQHEHHAGSAAILVDLTGSPIASISGYRKIPCVFSSSDDKHAVFRVQFGETTNFSLAIDSIYSSLPVVHGVEKCAVKPVGYWPCYFALIKKLCNCTATANPLISPSPSLKFPECTTHNYNICETRNLYDDCLEQKIYVPQCKTFTFDSISKVVSKKEMDRVYSESGKYSNSVIRIFMNQFTYAFIEEVPVFTFQQLLAAFGGMLGIWLGFSFFSLVWMIAFPIEFLLGQLFRRKNEKLSTFFDPRKNLKLKKTVRSHTFLTIEYLFDFKFDELRHELNLQKIVLYPIMAILFVVGNFKTFIMCLELFKMFNTGVTTSTILFMNNDTFTLPSSTLCISLINIADFEFIKSQQKLFHDEPVKELLNLNNKELLLNANWSYSMLQLSFENLAFYSQIERMGSFDDFLRKPIFSDTENCTLKIENCENGSLKNNWTAVQSFDRRIRSLNITPEELKQKCGMEFRKFLPITVEYINGSGNNTISDLVKETTFINEITICYKLQLDELIFLSKTEELTLLVNREFFPDFEKNISLTVDLNDRDSNLNHGLNFDGSIITAEFGDMSIFSVKIGAFYTASSYSNGALKCSGDEILENCQDNCRSREIQKYCNCTAVSWSRLSATSEKLCSLDDYMNCFQFSSATEQNYLNFQNDYLNCAAECLPSCTIIKYIQNLKKSSIEANLAQIVIKILYFPYFLYSEDFFYTYDSFISELGGDIGLWVGLDFLIFSHIIYYVLCTLLRLVLVSMKKVAISEEIEVPVVSLVHDDTTANRALPPVQSPKTILRIESLEY